MSEENTAATPAEASASAEPITDEASAEALFNSVGDGKTAPATEESAPAQAAAPAEKSAPAVPASAEPAKPAAPPMDPVKAAEARAQQIEQERHAKIVADEAARIEQERKAAQPAAAAPAAFDIRALEKNLLENDLKDFKISTVVDGKEVDVPLSDFMDDQKGYGEVARGMVSTATAIASKLIERAVAPLQEKIAAYENEKSRAAADAEHQDFIAKIAAETAHKDVVEVEKSQELWNWLKDQTPQMQSLASSKDIRDIDLLLSAFKSATGYKPAPASKPARQAFIERQRADLEKADKVARATSRSRASAPSNSDSDGDIETTEDAMKVFEAAAAEAAKRR